MKRITILFKELYPGYGVFLRGTIMLSGGKSVVLFAFHFLVGRVWLVSSASHPMDHLQDQLHPKPETPPTLQLESLQNSPGAGAVGEPTDIFPTYPQDEAITSNAEMAPFVRSIVTNSEEGRIKNIVRNVVDSDPITIVSIQFSGPEKLRVSCTIAKQDSSYMLRWRQNIVNRSTKINPLALDATKFQRFKRPFVVQEGFLLGVFATFKATSAASWAANSECYMAFTAASFFINSRSPHELQNFVNSCYPSACEATQYFLFGSEAADEAKVRDFSNRNMCSVFKRGLQPFSEWAWRGHIFAGFWNELRGKTMRHYTLESFDQFQQVVETTLPQAKHHSVNHGHSLVEFESYGPMGTVYCLPSHISAPYFWCALHLETVPMGEKVRFTLNQGDGNIACGTLWMNDSRKFLSWDSVPHTTLLTLTFKKFHIYEHDIVHHGTIVLSKRFVIVVIYGLDPFLRHNCVSALVSTFAMARDFGLIHLDAFMHQSIYGACAGVGYYILGPEGQGRVKMTPECRNPQEVRVSINKTYARLLLPLGTASHLYPKKLEASRYSPIQ